MKLISQILSLIIIFAIISCKKSDNNEPKFPKSVNISGEKLEFRNSQLNFPFDLVIMDSILIADDVSNNSLFQIYDLNKKQFLKFFGRKGDGPGEFKFHSQLSIVPNTNKIGINNRSKFTYSEISWEKILSDSSEIYYQTYGPFDTNYSKLIKITRTCFGGTGMFESRVGISDSTGQLINKIGSYPYYKKYNKEQLPLLGMAYQGHIKSKPDGSRIIVSSKFAATFDIFEIMDDSLLLIKQEHLWPAEFKGSDDPTFISVHYTDSNKFGYIDVSTSNNFIYMLYSGKPKIASSNTIHVYDWNGNRVAELKLDQKVRVIEISSNLDEFVYACPDNESNYIIKYDLSSFFYSD